MESQSPCFDTPMELMTFIQKCLETNDPASLYAACAEEVSDFWKPRIFQDFMDVEKTDSIAKIFLKDGFISAVPADTDFFPLGECSQQTRHLHIHLKKQDGHWRIQAILKCR